MLSRLHIGTFLGLAVVAWAVVLWARDIPLMLEHLWPYGLVLSMLVIAATIFERWGWAWRIFQGWFVKRPDLRGSWHVELKSDWVNPDTGQKIDPINCYMAVRQSLTSLSMRLMTAESSSRLIAHKIVAANDGVFLVVGVYTNTPKLELRGGRSEIHYGALLLQVLGEPPTSLEGHYWTDRNSRGAMRLSNKKAEIFSTYAEARDRCAPTPLTGPSK